MRVTYDGMAVVLFGCCCWRGAGWLHAAVGRQVSAKNGYGVSNAFYTLAVDIVQAMEAANKRGNDERRAAR